jgi:hypothetical protein
MPASILMFRIPRDLLETEFERWKYYIKISINSLTPFHNSLCHGAHFNRMRLI